jgi:hypothetical protein
MKATKGFVAVIILMIFLPACSSMMTKTSVYEGMDEAISQNNFSIPIQQLEKNKNKAFSEKDRVLFYLNMGMLLHYHGEYDKSNQMLTLAERSIEELFTASASKIAASFLLNDNALDYSGEDYEDIYLNVFKALNFAHLGESDASFIELNRLHHKIQQLETKYTDMSAKYQQALKEQVEKEDADDESLPEFKPGTLKFHNSAIGNALGVILYRFEKDYDDAEMDKRKMLEAFAGQAHLYSFDPPSLSVRPAKRDNAQVALFSFHGLGPLKESANFRITTFSNYVVISSDVPEPFSQTLSWPVKGGYHFKFSLPYLVERQSVVHQVKVKINNGKAIPLQPLEDMNKIAKSTFEIKAPLIYLKSVSRSIIKGIAAEAGKEKMKDEIANPYLGLLAGFTTDVAVDVSENADLRISRFFPGYASIADLELPPGEYQIVVQYFDRYNNIVHQNDLGKVNINPGQLNILESFCLQ